LKPTDSRSDYTARQLPRPNTRDLAALAGIICAGLFALRGFIFAGSSLYWGDVELYFAPMQQFLDSSLRQGRIPLWNPYILCGQPFVGDPQTFVLYPSTIFAGLFSAWQFVTVDACVHLIVGGIFAYALARDLERSRAASILASLTFMLGGYFIGKIQFVNMAQAIAFTPAVVWQAARLARRPSWIASVWLGVLVGLQLLAAHAQITVLTLYLAAAYALFASWPRLRQDRTEWLRLAGFAGAAIAFACCLAAGQLLPDIETWRNADHLSLSLAVANRFVLEPGQQIGFIYPYAFGSPFTANFDQFGNFWETACYLGVIPCLLMLVAIVDCARRRAIDICFWLAIFVASVWLAEGRAGGLYTLAFYCVPGLRAFHDPARMLIGAAVAGPLLAAYGLDALRAHRKPSLCYAIGAVVLMATTLDLGSFDSRIYPTQPTAVLNAAFTGASAAPVIAGHRLAFPPDNRITWRYFVDYDNYRQSEPSYLASLMATRTSDVNMFAGTLDSGGYEPEPPAGAVARYVRAYNLAEQHDFSAADQLAVDSVISFDAYRTSGATGFFAAHREIVLRNPDASHLTRARLTDGSYLPVTDPNPDRVEVAIPPVDRPQLLTLADTDMPGWQATIDAVPIKITRTPNGLRQVALPPSALPRSLTFTYSPATCLLGLYLTLATLGLALGIQLYAVSSMPGLSGANAVSSKDVKHAIQEIRHSPS
jgi:hypothetical protein